MEKKLCSSAQSYWRISKLTFSLILLISLCTPLLPAQATTTNANQIQAVDLLQIPVAQSLHLDQIVLDGETTPASLKLERFEVFAPDVQIVVHDGQGHEQIQSRPATAYFRGEIIGAPHSLVVLSADPDGTMRGIAQQGEKLWILAGGTAAGGPHLGLVSREVAQSGGLMGLPPFQCGVEGRMKELTPPSLFHLDTVPAVPLSAGQFYKVPVAIETDGEFYTLFGNSDAATSYIGNLFAYASVIYNREASAKLIVSSVSLWSGGPASDPWNHTSTLNGLEDFRSYWNANRTAVSRATAHFLSGRNLGGGIAYLGVLCDTTYGYGYSADISGQFQINNPQPVWDIIVVTHEIGHNFSSPHTHCYGGIGGNSNPVDACWNSENGCWSGATSLPGVNSLTGGTSGGGNGTIMSYCHQLGGGLSNIALTFGQNHTYGIAANRVSSRIAGYVASVATSYPNCISVGSDGATYTLTLAKAGTGT
ncbi:MAG: zinc-dependent metalloprotease, partial [Candidatus Contendobacter sp.]|nr:zinc-dependent metalloprotease [Candidatus Contendobacter sp.]